MTERAYGSPDAFRRALTDRLRAVARESRWDLAQLQRQMAYDRLLERLYFVDDGWIVKARLDSSLVTSASAPRSTSTSIVRRRSRSQRRSSARPLFAILVTG